MAGNQQGRFATIVTDDVVEFVADLMGKRWKKHEIKAYLLKELDVPKISVHSFEVICTRARKAMAERSERPASDMKRDAIEFYESVVRDEDATYKDRIKAQEQLDKIFALDKESGESPQSKVSKAMELLNQAKGLMGEPDGSDS